MQEKNTSDKTRETLVDKFVHLRWTICPPQVDKLGTGIYTVFFLTNERHKIPGGKKHRNL